MTDRPQISVVVPLLNEEESLPELVDWIRKVMQANGFTYEVILVDDGSSDGSLDVMRSLSKDNGHVKGISFSRNNGKSAALDVGFRAAAGEVIFTMDADLQDSPDELPEMYRMIVEENYDIVSGWKKKRYDPLSKTIPTKLFNAVTRSISGVKLHDFNCGLKAYKSRVAKSVNIYGELHRYIPVLAKWNGFGKIGEKVVEHRARKYGTTKFGLERFIFGFLDLLSITFVSKFRKRPMHFFGSFGTLSFLFGFFITLFLIGKKIYEVNFGNYERSIVDQPLFYLSLVALIIGVQLFTVGFLGEMIVRTSSSRNDYLVQERLNLDSFEASGD